MDSESESEHPVVTDKPRKRKSGVRKREMKKQRRLSTHVTGQTCECSRLKCFEKVTSDQQKEMIGLMNKFKSKNEKMAFLTSCMKIKNIARRRQRLSENEPSCRKHSYKFFVRIRNQENDFEEVPVCQQAFISLHGITNRTVQTIQTSISKSGKAPIDGRGKHTNRPHKLTDETRQAIHAHIQSLRCRKSHYSRHKSSRLYLPEDLNYKKLYDLFKLKNPTIKVSYDTYVNIFKTSYNIGFGYPRSDTCSFCDENAVKMEKISKDIENAGINSPLAIELTKQKKELKTELQLHLKTADTFYARKRTARRSVQTNLDTEAIAMDFQKNLPVPNISTNDVYYKRQLSFYHFNIHELCSKRSFFYTYPQTVARKGSDEVSSMLYDYVMHRMKPGVRKLKIFCDSCAGQNKNYTMIRFLHHLVQVEGRLDKIEITFPIRGHSYMECDKNMGIINQKTKAEVPSDWVQTIKNARANPSPFVVIEVDQTMIIAFTRFLTPSYKKACPFETRPVREIVIEKQSLPSVKYRNNYNGPWDKASLKPRGSKQGKPIRVGQQRKYVSPIPITQAKYNDLQILKRFCSEEHHSYYDGLPCGSVESDSE